MFFLEVIGNPVPLMRPRAYRKGNFIGIYDAQAKLKDQAKWQLQCCYRERPLIIPLHIDLTFSLPIAKATSKVKRRLMLQNDIVPMKKPDIDNLVKFILDCLNGILFDDDSQIVELNARKIYSDVPKTTIKAYAINKVPGEQESKDENPCRDN